MLDQLKQALKSRQRRKKFERMKEQLDPKPRPRPTKKTIPK